MPRIEDVLPQLQAATEEYLGTSDEVLARYIFNLGSSGRRVVKTELSEFPSAFVDKILSLLGLDSSKPSNSSHAPKVGSQCSGSVIESSPGGIIVDIYGSDASSPIRGLIQESELANFGKLKPGDRVRLQLIGTVNNGMPLCKPLSKRNGKTDVTTRSEASGPAIPRETTMHTSAQPSTSREQKRHAYLDLVVSRGLPEFLKSETTAEAPDRASLPSTPNLWLGKAAQHTSSKVHEVSSSNSGHDRSVMNDYSKKINQFQPQAKRNKKVNDGSKNNEPKKELPVLGFRHEILQALAENPIIVVVGDTGSGKTTQITQFLYDAGYADHDKVIACTQPRRIAAISVAERVADEMHSGALGQTVGYSVRFDDCTSKQTRVKYMTDGLLLREIVSDPDLKKYSVIMLDEAHERTVSTDILFALLKTAASRRPDLRVIVTSATLEAAKFGIYFDGAPILRIPGRMHPVTIEWAEEPILDYMEAALAKVKHIHEVNKAKHEPGDILVFLTGQAEIDLATAAILEAYPQGDLIPIPVYAAIPSEMQALIFNPAPEGKRKVVFATNIAETSLTIDGIKFVVDPGFSKVQVWDAKKGMGVLRVNAISQAQANQRLGRAGRTAPGVCYRLYTKNSFEKEMIPSTLPEIQRENLGNTVLLLKAVGINDLLSFDYMDPPPRNSLVSSMHDLYALGALDEQSNITQLGRSMAYFPLDPALAKVLITAQGMGSSCLEDILTIISMISTPSVFYRPSHPASKKLEADNAHRRLQDITSDHITLLNVYNKWKESGFSKKWCTNYFIQHKNLLKVRDARRQLHDLIRGNFTKERANTIQEPKQSSKEHKKQILQALCSGYFQNVARYDGADRSSGGLGYVTLAGGTRVGIHPSSVLFRQSAEYVLYSTLMMTSKEYMHTVSQVDPDWLLLAAPGFYKEADIEDIRKRQRTEALKPLFKKNMSHENEWRVSEQRKTFLSKKHR